MSSFNRVHLLEFNLTMLKGEKEPALKISNTWAQLALPEVVTMLGQA